MDPIQSLERAAAVLAAISAGDEDGKRMIDIAGEVGLNKSTIHRILGTLERLGFVDREPTSGRYYIGYRLFALSLAATHRFGLARLAENATGQLAVVTGDTVFLSVRQGCDALCIDRVVGAYPIKTLTLDVGALRPLGVGAGSLALLAWLSDAEIEAILDANQEALEVYPHFDAPAIREQVALSREQGYTYNDERVIAGMSAIGVPIRGRNGRPIAAISVAAVESRMGSDRRQQIVAWATDAAAEMEVTVAGPDGLTSPDLRHLVAPIERNGLAF